MEESRENFIYSINVDWQIFMLDSKLLLNHKIDNHIPINQNNRYCALLN